MLRRMISRHPRRHGRWGGGHIATGDGSDAAGSGRPRLSAALRIAMLTTLAQQEDTATDGS